MTEEEVYRVMIDAANAQAALLQAMNGSYLQTWQGDALVRESMRESILGMGKIARGEAVQLP